MPDPTPFPDLPPASHRPDVMRAVAAAVLADLGAAADPAARIGADLVERYQEPQRRYHTLRHVAEMLAVLGRARDREAGAIPATATWFHDAVYDPMAGDNEERSAALAERVLTDAGVPPAAVARVAALVRATATHAAPAGLDEARLLETARFLDADLAILGSAPTRYAAYVADVRAEFGHVPDDAWRIGRGAVLRSFVERPRLYATDELHQRFDAAARRNLAAELAALGSEREGAGA